MLKRFFLIGVSIGISLGQVHAQNYYKWVDSKGNVTYSSKPPPTGAKQQKIDTLRSLGNAPAPQKSYTQSARYSTQQSNPSQAYAAPRQPERNAEQQQAINENPLPGARGLTARQRNAMAGLPNYNNSSSNAAPSTITNCDSAGCWGSDGTRYNKGAGNTYFPSTGGACQNTGGQMQCQ